MNLSSINSKITKFFQDHLAGEGIDPDILKPFMDESADQLLDSYFSQPLANKLEPSQFELDLSSADVITELLTADKRLLGKGLPLELVRDLLELKGELGEVDQAPEISDLIYVMY